ncbi:MAG: SufD family Fe-S cluster assembly protein, partial [Anaerotignum sp.]|nr:SufD family Fe-S cluster assembly protein [Anaerotignum sp.]
MLNDIVKNLLNEVSGLIPTTGAFNIRNNGQSEGRKSTENIDIVPKPNGAGLDIYVKPFTKNEDVHIPALITADGVHDVAYNDFHIGEGAEIKIIAGCGIHNCGDQDSRHDGVHTFYVGKNSKVKYTEKHYGGGDGRGGKIMNPETVVYLDEGAFLQMESTQIRGVDSTKRYTRVEMESNAEAVVTERLLTHGHQIADSDMVIELNGEDSKGRVISRSVAQEDSEQVFYPRMVGNAESFGHVQCDSIIIGNA